MKAYSGANGRLEVLTALKAGPGTIEQLTARTGQPNRSVAANVSNLRQQGAVLPVGAVQAKFRMVRVWAITPHGEAVLRDPSPQRLAKRGVPGELAHRQHEYALSHAKHVERQRAMRLPECDCAVCKRARGEATAEEVAA